MHEEYNRYEELLLRRDQLEREAESIRISYQKEFGAQVTAAFEAKLACIRLKKSIAYCRQYLNRGERIDLEGMSQSIEEQMALYELELRVMQKEHAMAKKAETASVLDVQRARKLYRRLAKRIHPDLHPQVEGNEELSKLWNRIMQAYRRNDPRKLEELEILVRRELEALGWKTEQPDIPDLTERILLLEEEISEILTTRPYTYCHLLEDEDAVAKRKEELEQERQEYEAYQVSLEAVLRELITKGGAHFQCQMN